MKNLGFFALLLTIIISLSSCSSETAEVDSSGSSVQGDTINVLSEMDEKPSIVFYFTYGTPCLNTFPELQKVYEKCDGDLAIYGAEATNASVTKAQGVIRDKSITFPVFITSEAQNAGVMDLYPARSLPTLTFNDVKGERKYVVVGQQSEATLDSFLQQYLSLTCGK